MATTGETTSKTNELQALFETEPDESPFPDELGAVASGLKPIAMFEYPTDVLSAKGDDSEAATDYRAVIARALELGLVVVYVPHVIRLKKREIHNLHVFVARATELWRVPAYSELSRASDNYAWSESFEAALSGILGYNDEQTLEWIRSIRRRMIRSGVATLYVLLDVAQRRTVEAGGCRSLPSETLCIFFNRHQQIIRKGIAELPNGQFVARVGVPHARVSSIVGNIAQPDKAVVYRDVSASDVEAMNEVLETRVQFWDGNDWK